MATGLDLGRHSVVANDEVCWDSGGYVAAVETGEVAKAAKAGDCGGEDCQNVQAAELVAGEMGFAAAPVGMAEEVVAFAGRGRDTLDVGGTVAAGPVPLAPLELPGLGQAVQLPPPPNSSFSFQMEVPTGMAEAEQELEQMARISLYSRASPQGGSTGTELGPAVVSVPCDSMLRTWLESPGYSPGLDTFHSQSSWASKVARAQRPEEYVVG